MKRILCLAFVFVMVCSAVSAYWRNDFDTPINVCASHILVKTEAEALKIKSEIKMLNDLTIEEHYNYYLSQGLDNKEAMKKVAKDRGVSKSDIYKVINC